MLFDLHPVVLRICRPNPLPTCQASEKIQDVLLLLKMVFGLISVEARYLGILNNDIQQGNVVPRELSRVLKCSPVSECLSTLGIEFLQAIVPGQISSNYLFHSVSNDISMSDRVDISRDRTRTVDLIGPVMGGNKGVCGSQ